MCSHLEDNASEATCHWKTESWMHTNKSILLFILCGSMSQSYHLQSSCLRTAQLSYLAPLIHNVWFTSTSLCWACFTAILGHMQLLGCGLGTPDSNEKSFDIEISFSFYSHVPSKFTHWECTIFTLKCKIYLKTINLCCQLALKYSLNYINSKKDLRQLTKKTTTTTRNKTRNKQTKPVNNNKKDKLL